jgi:hypothetical protein
VARPDQLVGDPVPLVDAADVEMPNPLAHHVDPARALALATPVDVPVLVRQVGRANRPANLRPPRPVAANRARVEAIDLVAALAPGQTHPTPQPASLARPTDILSGCLTI